MTPQSQTSPETAPRSRSTVAPLVPPDASVPRTFLDEAVRADRRQLQRWENEGGALGSAGAGPWAVSEGGAG